MARAAITAAHLRRFAVARSLFPPTTLRRAISRLGFVQADPGGEMGSRLKGVLLKYLSARRSERGRYRMPCSEFLFFRRVIGTPQLAPFLAKAGLSNTPLNI
jgi:hypothetical protein